MSRRKVVPIHRGDEMQEHVARLRGFLGLLEDAIAERDQATDVRCTCELLPGWGVDRAGCVMHADPEDIP